MPSQKLFNLESTHTKAFRFKRLNYLPVNELRPLLFLILRKVMFESKRVLNIWGKFNFIALFLDTSHTKHL